MPAFAAATGSIRLTHAAEQLLPLVYDELRKLAARKMAQEAPGKTLQATALVHEAYLRLVDAKAAQAWNSRGHFFAAAAEAMRRILIESARSKAREKRGGDWRRVNFERLDVATRFLLINWSPWTTRSRAWRPSTTSRVNWSSFAILPVWLWTRPPRPWAFRRQPLIDTGPTHAPGYAANY